MGRLIDTDEMEKKLEEILCEPDYQHTGENWSVGMSLAQSATYDIPTAYDVEEVIKKIQKIGEDSCKYLICNIECQDCDYGIMMREIIDVVRQGGVKND